MRQTRCVPAARVATIAAVLAGASTALAAPGIDARALQVPAITQLRRVGVAVVGPQNDETLAARDFAAKSLVRAGHAVAGMQTFAAEPSPARLVAACADHDVDAVALVRISTDATGWRVNVDIRDPEGERIVIGSETRHQHDPFGGSEVAQPAYASFSFAMNAADVAAQKQRREEEALQRPAPPVVDAAPPRPRLWVTDKVAMFGPAQLRGAEFYQVVGRPDLAAAYERNRSSIRTVRGFGYTALGIGGTTLVLALAVAAAATGACALPNTIDALDGKQATCGNGVDALFLIPLAFTVTGGVLLASASAMTLDPLTLQERRELARAYNARVDSAAELPAAAARPARRVKLGVAGAPLPGGNGGVMTLTGRF